MSYFISGVLLLVVGYLTVSGEWYLNELLSCQPRVTVTSCFVYKVIRDLYSIDHMCIYPTQYTSDLSIRVSSRGGYKLKFHLTIVNIILRYCHSWLVRQ